MNKNISTVQRVVRLCTKSQDFLCEQGVYRGGGRGPGKKDRKMQQLKGWEHNQLMSNFSPFLDVARICPNFCM